MPPTRSRAWTSDVLRGYHNKRSAIRKILNGLAMLLMASPELGRKSEIMFWVQNHDGAVMSMG